MNPLANQSWAIGCSQDQQLMRVESLPSSSAASAARREKLDIQESGISRLGSIVQALPGLLTRQEVTSSQYLRVEVNGTLAKAADGNGLRAFVRDENGKFVEHARLFESDRLKTLVNTAALFQIASVVVAQQHLADISAKLSEIKQGIERIEAHLQNERRSTIEGMLTYLRQEAPSILEGDLAPAVLGQLERFETDLTSIQLHLAKDMDTAIGLVSDMKNPEMFGTRQLTDNLNKQQDDFRAYAEQWQLCLAGRSAICRMLGARTDDYKRIERRQQALCALAESFFGRDGQPQRFNEAIGGQAGKLNSRFESRSVIQANKLAIELATEKHVMPLITQARSNVEQLQGYLTPTQGHEPVVMELEIRGDRLIAAHALR
ncbi:hypothetical protein DCO48_17345 [Pseudomonas sp. SDI]|uniref:hypothetical protein n=1 Tax=Pseudomonas sp. SDI TaxID=2170734 RepID=UPI000DE72475|nr:hypothetical protein [Pseudomonas sp. SDI]PWB31424.1 hypothetical protein DCO48_17345 [Pseudomonas sp. SDI]